MKRYPAQIWNWSNGGHRYKTALSREHESAVVEKEHACPNGTAIRRNNPFDFQKKPGAVTKPIFQGRSSMFEPIDSSTETGPKVLLWLSVLPP
jgi:hypothetical protein